MSALHEIAEVIGFDAAVRLGQSMGGARMYVPKAAADDHPLTIILGQEYAQRLCDFYAGDMIDIPSKRLFREVRDNLIRQDYHTMKLQRGCRADHLALKYGLSRRQVLNITKLVA
ncbi:MAG: hypothetical protein K0U59_06540 [Gammaproteobacteria bacterium]|nr:hypothetical protein [Gammaproteobacteria bacterium]